MLSEVEHTGCDHIVVSPDNQDKAMSVTDTTEETSMDMEPEDPRGSLDEHPATYNRFESKC